jgi:transposase-like protein
MSGRKGSLHYTVKVKEDAVRLFLEVWTTYQSIAEKLGIRKAERIRIWVRDYRKEANWDCTRSKAAAEGGTGRLCSLVGNDRQNGLEKVHFCYFLDVIGGKIRIGR